MTPSSALFAAVASPRRREILRLIWAREVSAGDIHRSLGDVSFGAVSLQLAVLKRAGLVDVRADGRSALDAATENALGPVASVLEPMWRDALWRLKLAAELEHSRRGPRPRRARTSRRRPS